MSNDPYGNAYLIGGNKVEQLNVRKLFFLHRTGKWERLSHNCLRHQLHQIKLPIRLWPILRIKTRSDVVINRFRTGHADGSRVKPDRKQTYVLGDPRAIKSKASKAHRYWNGPLFPRTRTRTCGTRSRRYRKNHEVLKTYRVA